MKKERILSKIDEQKKTELRPSQLFIFCEKTSGAAQFRAESGTNTENAVERMAGLLAMQCLVRGHDPDDFVVLVPAESSLTSSLVSRAKQLLNEGRAVARPASLSPRQSEILHSVIRNQANKEIASKLNITVRTVKFHISSLLSKFGVDNRAELARRATGLMHAQAMQSDDFVQESQETRRAALRSASTISDKGRNFRYPGNALTA